MSSPTTSFLLFRYEAKQFSYQQQLNQTGLRFVSSPEITTKLYTIPIDEEEDLVPPCGSLEKSSLIYLLTTTSSSSSSSPISEFCSDCRDISGKLSLIGNFVMDQNATKNSVKFVKRVKEVSSTDVVQAEEEEEEEEEEEKCFFCRSKVIAYSSFAFATSANAAFTTKPISEAYLVSVVVSKDFRKQGLCSKLLAASFHDISDKYDSKNEDVSIQRMRLHVRNDLPFLKEMYLKFGFLVRRNCPRYYPNQRIDAVEMLMEKFRETIAAKKLAVVVDELDETESGKRRERDQF